MNPMSLLTKGRTFGGLKDRRGAYKLAAGYALPNFAGAKGPSFGPARPPKEPAAPFAQPKPTVAAALPPPRADAVPTAPKVAAGYALPNFAGPKAPSFGPARPPKEPAAPFAQPKPAIPAALPPKRANAVPAAPKVMGKTLDIWPERPGLCRRAARWFEEILGRPPKPARPAPSVQTELVLDKVTVVRNDLSEDDVVVVLAEKSTSDKVEPEKQMTSP
jgi:hypothetical protein